MDMEVVGCRGSGRPRKIWKECVRQDIASYNLESVDPLDRVNWRRAVRDSLLLPTRFRELGIGFILFLPAAV